MGKPKTASVIKAQSQVKKITVKMPQYMRQEMTVKIVKDGYNMRQKSKWIAEAVRSLISRTGWEDVLMAQSGVKTEIQDVITLPIDLHEKVNEEVRRVMVDKPFLNPSQSSIIRAAIQRRTMGIKF